MNWITSLDTIIFNSEYNEEFDINLIFNYSKLIFSDYKLSNKLFEYYANNGSCHFQYNESKFNKNISNLLSNIIHLTFGSNFNQDVSKLSPKHNTFNFW